MAKDEKHEPTMLWWNEEQEDYRHKPRRKSRTRNRPPHKTISRL